MKKLAWGASGLVPADAPAAWGARLIVKQDGYVDLVPDRQDAVGEDGPRKALLKHLNEVAKPLGRVAEMLKAREILTSEEGEVTVYEDAKIVVRGNSNGSYGYFYIAAYARPAEPGIVLPRGATGEPGTVAGTPIWLKLIRRIVSAEASQEGSADGRHPRLFKLLEVGPGEDGQYRESYVGADVVFPSYDESIVRVVPKSDYAASVIAEALAALGPVPRAG
jgi:hypothetical protein